MTHEQAAQYSLLRTRLHKPKTCSDVIIRTRLFDQLDGNLDNPLTLISAPAGFGKTTLVTSWLDCRTADSKRSERPHRTAWLSVDAADNDPHSFFVALIAAIESVFPDACADARDILQAGRPQSWLKFAGLVAQACTALPERLIFVWDDYYLITNDDVHRASSDLISQWGDCVHLIIVTRTNPPLNLSRLRAQQHLVEIRAGDMQFELDETTQFMHAQLGADVSAESVNVLHSGTEGWAAGLRLAAISLRQHPNADDFTREFERNSNRYIMEYLMDEVLKSQPEELQAFLFHTAILPRMCSALCAAVTDRFSVEMCQSMLDLLDRRNLFIVSLDDHRGWYRYHHQFRTLLLNQMRQSVADTGIMDLWHRGVAWLAANGYPDEAIGEYAALQAFDEAAQVIEDNLAALQNDEQWPRLAAWLRQLPPAILDQRPGLLIALAWVKRFQYDNATVGALAARVESLLECADEAQRSRWLPQVLALKTVGDVTPDIEERLDAARKAELLAPREHVWVRSFALIRAAQTRSDMGELQASLSMLDQADFNDGKSLARLHFTAAIIHYREGALAQLLWHAEQCRDFAVQYHMPMTAAWGECGMGLGRLHQNILTDAERHFRTVLQARHVANRQTLALSSHGLVSILAERGDFEAARSVVNAVREVETWTDSAITARISNALTGYLALCQGDNEGALAWMRRSTPDSEMSAAYRDPEWPVLLSILLAQNSPASLIRAQDIVTATLNVSERGSDHRNYNEALTWLARVRYAQNRHAEAQDALADAVAFAQPRGIVRWFVAGGESVRDVLMNLVRSGRCVAEATALLADIASTQRRPSANGAAPDPHDALTNREFELLELLAGKLTNKEIAARLKISPHTVRNHTHQIYNKLNVASRRQAVQQARSRGLIR